MFKTRFAFSAVPLLAATALFAFDGPAPVPVGKRVIEASPKAVVQSTTAKPDTNPTVEAGKVKWHATMDDAMTASKKSGKPVLLFQMLGRLDKQFC